MKKLCNAWFFAGSVGKKRFVNGSGRNEEFRLGICLGPFCGFVTKLNFRRQPGNSTVLASAVLMLASQWQLTIANAHRAMRNWNPRSLRSAPCSSTSGLYTYIYLGYRGNAFTRNYLRIVSRLSFRFTFKLFTVR